MRETTGRNFEASSRELTDAELDAVSGGRTPDKVEAGSENVRRAS
jgi:hypothetical protein